MLRGWRGLPLATDMLRGDGEAEEEPGRWQAEGRSTKEGSVLKGASVAGGGCVAQ